MKIFIHNTRLSIIWGGYWDKAIYLFPTLYLEKTQEGHVYNIVVFRFIKWYISFYFGPNQED